MIKANRCSVENNFHDLKILQAVAETSRHTAGFHAVYVGAAARLCNHLWRRQLANGLALFDVLNTEVTTSVNLS